MTQHNDGNDDGVGPHPHDWFSGEGIRLINRALFDDWLHRYGSWEAFLHATRKGRRGPADDAGVE